MDKYNLPSAIDVETSVLGGSIVSKKACADAMNNLDRTDFVSKSNQHLFAMIHSMYHADECVDLTTVIQAVKDKGYSELIPQEQILKCTDSVSTESNILYLCKILRKKTTARKAIIAAHKHEQSLYKTESPDSDIEALTNELYGIQTGLQKKQVEKIGDVLPDWYEYLERKVKGNIDLVNTGFINVDAILNGFEAGDLSIIAARPSVGKTAFALDVMIRLSVNRKKVLFMSLETPKRKLMNRVIANMGKVNLSKLVKGATLIKKDFDLMRSATDRVRDLDIYINDDPYVTPEIIRTNIRYYKPDIVFLDYLQKIKYNKKSTSRYDRISEATTAIKNVAMETDTPIVALAQIGRQTERDKMVEPTLSDLKESGQIEQDAENVIIMHCEERSDTYRDIIIAKQKDGATGRTMLNWSGEYQQFTVPESMHETKDAKTENFFNDF